MEQKQLTRQYCQQFNMSGVNKVIDELILQAESQALASWITLSASCGSKLITDNIRTPSNGSNRPDCQNTMT